MRRILSLFVLLMLSTVLAFGQKRTVTGKVTDNNGEVVPFASIKVKGAKSGVAADINGNFKIEIPEGATIEVSATGYGSKELVVTAAIANVTIEKSKNELTTVVVSALGIKRSVKSVTYGTQQISSERLSQTRETDITTALSGKIAGVQVLGQADAKLGSGGNIRIRGASSLKDGGPLYILDGSPITNPADINFDDVATVNVLKGPSAAALYGQRGENGVIVVTTKKAKKGTFSVEVNQTTTFEQVNILPKYQDLYGGGDGEDWKTYNYTAGTSPAAWAPLAGKKYHDYTDDGNWGPKFDGSDYIPWYAWYPGTKYSFKTIPYTARPDNVKSFYENGIFVNNNLNLSKGGDNYSLRFSFTNFIRNGIQPNSNQNKNTASLQGSYDITKELTINASVQYTWEKIKGDFVDGYSNYTSGSFNQWYHRDNDMNVFKELRNLQSPSGALASWNLGVNPVAGTQLTDLVGNYWYNHYTYLDYAPTVSNRNRLLGSVGLTYKLNSNFRFSGNVYYNLRKTDNDSREPFILQESNSQASNHTWAYGSTNFNEMNYEFLASYNKSFDKFTLEVNAGANYQDLRRGVDSFVSGRIKSSNPDVYQTWNFDGTPSYGGTVINQDKKVLSLFTRASVGYKDMLFLDMTLRRDWSSVLPKNANGYTTPSAGLSFVFSELTKEKFPALSFGKLRASWATIGTDGLSPNELNVYYKDAAVKLGNNVLTSTPDVIVDQNIGFTINSALEFGTDLRFYRDRLGFSATYFYENKTDDIVPASVPTASGYTSAKINAGKVRRSGIELTLDMTPIKSKDFQWDVTFNWSKIDVDVLEVAPKFNINQINLESPGFTTSSVQFRSAPLPGVVQIKGERWGQLRGVGIKRINGLPVINDDGTYVKEANVNFGSVLPDYTGGVFTTLKYKTLSLTVSIDFQKGGKYFSLSRYWGQFSGLTAETAGINDNGKNVRDNVANGGGVHVFGVKADGKAYDTYVGAYDYFHQFHNSGGIAETSVFEATYVKVREISLNYDINLKKFPSIAKVLKRASIGVVARSPFMIYLANEDFDPSQLSQRFGENGQLPSTRQFGFNLRLGF
jgi:TonB-linked SusC/RagA family outer membrane protein